MWSNASDSLIGVAPFSGGTVTIHISEMGERTPRIKVRKYLMHIGNSHLGKAIKVLGTFSTKDRSELDKLRDRTDFINKLLLP